MAQNPNFNLLFITEEVFKELSPVNANTDMNVITPMFKIAQDKYVLRILGDSLMADLQNKAAEGSLNSDEQYLLNVYIQPLLVWGVMVEIPFSILYRYMNKGLEKKNSDNSNPADMAETQFLSDKNKDNMEFYSQRCINYIWQNRTLFPAFNMEQTWDQYRPQTRGFSTRLAMGKGNSCSTGWLKW